MPRVMRRSLLLMLAACSSPAAPTAEHPTPTAAVQQDAAPEPPPPPPPDAGPPQAVLDTSSWVFRYSTKDRNETWTLRYKNGNAVLVVETAGRQMLYLGGAAEGDTVKIDVASGTAKMSLDCKHAKRALGAKCNDSKAKPIEVLDCYHKDFKTPMPFGPAPGVEYVVDASCNGYRLVPKS
jgi:hypothetical protein